MPRTMSTGYKIIKPFKIFGHCSFVVNMELSCKQRIATLNSLFRSNIKGQGGGPRSIFTFLLFLIVENVSSQELFFGMKFFFLAKVFAILILKIHTITLRGRTLIAIHRKSTLKSRDQN